MKPRTFIGKGIRHGDAMEHAYECHDCEEGKVEFCRVGHSGDCCPCPRRRADCPECDGSGVRYDSECECADCVAELAAYLCTEHYGEERAKCEECLQAKSDEIMRGFWAALRETA